MYQRNNHVPHFIDFMHIEKNFIECLVKTLLNIGKMKCGLNALLDLAEFGIRPQLFAKEEDENITLPLAGQTLTNNGKYKFCETLQNIRAP